MEIKVNIPVNNYVQPTEVREEVVQKVCDFILTLMKRSVWVEDTYELILRHKNWSYLLFLNLREDGTCIGFTCEEKPKLNQIRIRSVEMQAVFSAFQDAGYYIFGWSFTTGEKHYVFTKKPIYDNRKATRMEFTEFID